MNEFNKQKEKPDGHEKLVNEEGSAARTRPTSVEEIRLRRKRKESLENVKEETVGAAQLLGSDLVEQAFDYHESEKGYDGSENLRHEEHLKDSSRKENDAISSSREEKLVKPMKEDPVGAAQLPGQNLVEKVLGCHESEKGYDRSEKLRHEELVMDSSRKKEEAISSSREEILDKPMKDDKAAQLLGNDLVENIPDYHAHDRSKKVRREERVKDSLRKKEDTTSSSREETPMKEDHVRAAQLLGYDIVEKVPDYHASEKGNERSKKVRREERVRDSSRKKEDSISSLRVEKLMKEDHVGAAQLLGHNIVEKVSDYHASEKGHDRSKKVTRDERVKDSSRKKEDATSSLREEKPMKEDHAGAAQLLVHDIVEKVSDYHASEKGHDRSTKVRSDERVKDSSRMKEDATSSSREERVEKPMKEDPVGAAQLLGHNMVEKVSDYHTSEKGHDRSKKVRREERVKDSSRKKEDAISSSREEKLMKEDHVGAAQFLGNDLVEMVSDYHESEKGYDRSEKLRREVRVKDSSRKKEEAISGSREEKLDKPKKVEPASNRKRKAERESSTAETESMEEHSKDRRGKKEETNSRCREERRDKKMKKEDLASNRKIEGEIPTSETKAMTDRDGLGSKKRLRSLVVADVPRDESSIKHDNEDKRKNQNGDHKKNREMTISKRHDSGKVHSVEVSERMERKEQPKAHERDMREKRRRSRSRDHGQDRQKRPSPLPRAEKATSRHKRSHEERSENVVKDRSGKHHCNDNEDKGASTVSNKSRRYSASKSELGGYSPRKRREEASTKAVSPPNLSSEKKSAKWDLAPTVTSGMFSGPVFSGLQAATQTAYPTISEASLMLLKPLMEGTFRTPPPRQITSFDSVQLTESTRPMRRLYAENVPDSASEKSLIECFNGYMLSSGSNHIKGSEPCISCIINKEKSQALVEFLTPQDASAALSLDGCSFAGSNLKIRRPKDYVGTTNGELEKKEPATNAVSDNVEDSSNKIFIGGFSKAISSEMLMEIVSVFGPLKAYRFVSNNDLNQQCAYLEYTDGSVTLKACAGLNGMKLGGSVITAVCAFPDASSVAVNENPPFYGIPGHAKPLLGKPKHILKLKNVVDPEDFTLLSEQEVKEILDDVRLECARFGVIKSINIVEHKSKDITVSETNALLTLESTDSKEMNVSVIQEKDEGSKKADGIAENVDLAEVIRPDSLTGEEKLRESWSDTAAVTNTQENEDQHSTEQDHCETIIEESAWDEAVNPQEVASVRTVKTRWDTDDKMEEERDPDDLFEPGCIFIEYGRPEATCDAAHSLHGRLYDNRIVKAEYVSKELYQIRFLSG
ncbi:ankyrin repeat domain-containing protein 12 [Arabidopsis lyrata subsp. lyrata]|uniref:ankyrin repeat domain-containing protein 12 n=1 Tax=Arabidopsis lyrata subsp. lyrata TaxID=81972 RepID=UPI000A29C65A|nr:ankyrin repeat domain-containing protein 12 [Arabidopsis lyrata subsp. lyrata]XP_020884390.1 ankyrin repeat domain-containing protein 12 [Arabidopsis lyrata subsp. lyrata]|eukprot:XP_020884389.1 ankyrin repeat domain-containing protein 12 [Arabidopsis lyrata subsp. lyrata]